MSILEDARRADTATRGTGDSNTDDEPTEPVRRPTSGGTATLAGPTQVTIRGHEVVIDGDEMTLAEPETKQPNETSGNFLVDQGADGVPRGTAAATHRNIAQTAAMQSIVNGIVDQLLGGELTFIDDEDAMESLGEGQVEATGTFKELIRDVLTGPHLGDEDLDDLVTAAVEDMLGVGNAYWQLLEPESGDLPVASLTTLDPLTIRHNVNRHGYPQDPPYYQVHGAFTGTSSSLGGFQPVPLQADEVAVMRFPKGNRSYRVYPVSAAWQVREWLEILADSVTHHKRYYSDNEVPPGLMQVVDASEATVESIQNQIEQAAGDPRDFPVVGGEAPANWIEMGGTAINLNVIEEQKWFFQMCLGSLGLGKAEVGLIEDVNRANGEIEADRVYKRVAGPFGKQFEQAFLHIARQFDLFNELGQPFTPTLAYTDPREEAARQDRLRKEFDAGTLTLRQYHRRLGNQDLADDPEQYEVTINGTTIDYGEHPWPVAKRLLSAAGATDPDAPGDSADGESESGSGEGDDGGT